MVRTICVYFYLGLATVVKFPGDWTIDRFYKTAVRLVIFATVVEFLGITKVYLRDVLALLIHCSILIKIPLASIAGWQNDLSIAPAATMDFDSSTTLRTRLIWLQRCLSDRIHEFDHLGVQQLRPLPFFHMPVL